MTSSALIEFKKKIMELPPYKAVVTPIDDTAVGSDETAVEWVEMTPDEAAEYNDDAWLIATIPDPNYPTKERLSVRIAGDIPGSGLVKNKNGSVDISYDPRTLEINASGQLSVVAKSSVGPGSYTGNGGFTLKPGWTVLEPTTTATDGKLYFLPSDRKFHANGSYDWVTVEVMMTVTVGNHLDNKWTIPLDVNIVVDGQETDYSGSYSLDTTEEINYVVHKATLYVPASKTSTFQVMVKSAPADAEEAAVPLHVDYRVALTGI